MIYLDNSATSFPKPRCVVDAVNEAVLSYGNYGRSSYRMAIETTEKVHECREKVARLFNVKNEKVVFTHNCTMSLNMAIKGLAKKGSHFIISDLEHNAVLRPLETLKAKGICDYTIAKTDRDAFKTLKNFEKCVNSNTIAIVCTGASNVFGMITPYQLLGDLAHKHGLKFILDGAQVAGIKKIDLKRDNIDILCCAGHKGLYGPSGIGLLVLNDNIDLDTIIEGGTGSNSLNYKQPDFMPDRLESGTPNIPGIIGLSSALDFIEGIGINKIFNHERHLMRYLYNGISNNRNITLYSGDYSNCRDSVPILSFNIKDINSDKVSGMLADNGICVRAGLHCAPLAHKKLGTENTGCVRISPSIFTKKNQIEFTINSLIKIAK